MATTRMAMSYILFHKLPLAFTIFSDAEVVGFPHCAIFSVRLLFTVWVGSYHFSLPAL